ncbi:kappa-carrageenase [Pontiella agarivorans]|uniref:Kappa-carrageenase n=1 Tax=Pontiella agarivorans TaxID=3038953 RepID=A0ABU5MUI6_9BACT|nr:kappa-carrageenase [Pontiella agarivorans]MDZ8117817.1 kappa-carrageenase [Pontiella agarivorans]
MKRMYTFLTVLLCTWTLGQELKGKAHFHSLEDAKGRRIDAKILYVGNHWVYLQHGFRKPVRFERAKLAESSNTLLDQWADAFMDALTAEELKRVVDTANAASKGKPLLVDPDPASGVWKLNETFSDEFNARTLDEKKWNRNLRPWGERAWRSENVWQTQGRLFIQAKWDPHRDRRGNEYFYTCGIAQSYEKTTYGYFEASIKGCSRFPGLCPAFWLYSNGREKNPDYPHITYSEIDIIEMLQGGFDPVKREKTGPSHMDCNLHTREIIDGKETWRRPQHWPEVCRNVWDAPWDPRDDFHVYACENTPEKITWYIDGIKVAESPNHNWHLPMTLTFTMELRPPLIDWAGEDGRVPVPENATRDGFPTHMEVDYVRSWVN